MVKRQLKQFAVYQDAAAPQTINVARQVGGTRSASRCLAVTVAATVLMTLMPPVPHGATTLAMAIARSSLNAVRASDKFRRSSGSSDTNSQIVLADACTTR